MASGPWHSRKGTSSSRRPCFTRCAPLSLSSAPIGSVYPAAHLKTSLVPSPGFTLSVSRHSPYVVDDLAPFPDDRRLEVSFCFASGPVKLMPASLALHRLHESSLQGSGPPLQHNIPGVGEMSNAGFVSMLTNFFFFVTSEHIEITIKTDKGLLKKSCPCQGQLISAA